MTSDTILVRDWRHNAQRGRIELNQFRHCLFLQSGDPSDAWLNVPLPYLSEAGYADLNEHARYLYQEMHADQFDAALDHYRGVEVREVFQTIEDFRYLCGYAVFVRDVQVSPVRHSWFRAYLEAKGVTEYAASVTGR